jgi:hypothetical protein
MFITIEVRPNDLQALGDALELADSCVSNSEYSSDARDQEANDKNSLRNAWKVYTRISDASIALLKANSK